MCIKEGFDTWFYGFFVFISTCWVFVVDKVSKAEPSSNGLTPAQAKEKASALKRELLVAIDKLGDSLPSNTLDELVDSFGGSDKVAEVS